MLLPKVWCWLAPCVLATIVVFREDFVVWLSQKSRSVCWFFVVNTLYLCLRIEHANVLVLSAWMFLCVECIEASSTNCFLNRLALNYCPVSALYILYQLFSVDWTII